MRVKTGAISAKHACMVRVKVNISGQTCLHGENKGREGGREGARTDGPTWTQEPEAMAKR